MRWPRTSRSCLQDGGVATAIAGDAKAAVSLAASREFDLALVDVRLPAGESGVDLVPVLRRGSPDMEVILMTANATLDHAIAAVRHGAFAFLLKPFAPEDLEAVSQRALAQVALRRERVELARELARSEALYRAVVDTADAIIVGVGTDGVVQIWNRRAAELTGVTAEDSRGRPSGELLVDPLEGARARWGRALEQARSRGGSLSQDFVVTDVAGEARTQYAGAWPGSSTTARRGPSSPASRSEST